MEFYHILFYSSENTSAFSLPFRLSLNLSINIFSHSLSLSIALFQYTCFLLAFFFPMLFYRFYGICLSSLLSFYLLFHCSLSSLRSGLSFKCQTHLFQHNFSFIVVAVSLLWVLHSGISSYFSICPSHHPPQILQTLFHSNTIAIRIFPTRHYYQMPFMHHSLPTPRLTFFNR